MLDSFEYVQIIRHESLGELVIDKVYFHFDVPIQFLCHWSERPSSMYFGQLFEQFMSNTYDSSTNELVSNYYLAPVNNAILSNLESKNFTLKELFEQSTVMWISHRLSLTEDKQSTLTRDYGRINPAYSIPEGTTLCI